MSVHEHFDVDAEHVEDLDHVEELHLAALAGWCVAGALAWVGLVLAAGVVLAWLGELA